MKITNKRNLPASIVRAIQNDPYDAKDSDITVTQLIQPPQIQAILREHKEELEQDASEMLWSLYGSAIHYVIERGVEPPDIAEERLYYKFQDWIISGQFDLLELSGPEVAIVDFKLTSVWAITDAIKNGKSEWEAQLNVLRWLAGHCQLPEIGKLKIIAMARDWSEMERMRTTGYPRQVEVIDIPLWEWGDLEFYILNAVKEHKEAREGKARPCTDKERWIKPGKFALMKEGRKSAVRLLDTPEEIMEYAEKNGYDKPGYTIEERPTRYFRCEKYCLAAKWCGQWNEKCMNL